MNLNKSLEYFDPENIDAPIHIIGVGAVGSTIVENLTRLGIKSMHIYDFDVVSEHNVANQMFLPSQVGMSKLDAIEQIAKSINPDIKLIKHPKGWTETSTLEGYVFICPDSITVRQQIVKKNKFNPNIIAMFDTRMRLTDAQHYACEWCKDAIDVFYKTMDFTQEEAAANTPVSACGTTLNVFYIVRMIVALEIANFVKFVKTGQLNKMIVADAETFIIDAI